MSTRKIALASGVAEGTIFRAFPDKEALISAVIAAAFDPGTMLAELRQVEMDQPLRERMLRVTEIMQARFIKVISLISAVRMNQPPAERERQRGLGQPANELIYEELVRILAPDRKQLGLPPREVARRLRLLTFAGSHFMITDGQLMTPDEIVSTLLDGVRRRPPENRPTAPGSSRC